MAFRCGAELVTIGDTRDEVRNICGEPQSVEAWTEERLRSYPLEPYIPYGYGRDHRYVNPYQPFKIVRVEEWVYNLGSSRLIRYLRFENNRLKKIETGGYGY
ncbi:MAG: DUF2845 domain-containing protein [Desulfobulbaceae bacterium]